MGQSPFTFAIQLLLLAAWLPLQIHASCDCTPSPAPANCFPDKQALVTAVDAYITDPTAWAASPNGGGTYGAVIGNWCTGLITDMEDLFLNKASFNEDIAQWDTAAVTTMKKMFKGATLFNKNIGTWDVSKVKIMRQMFEDAVAFNGNIGQWSMTGGTGSLTNMYQMFKGATSFTQDLDGWDTSKVTSMYETFMGATQFNGNIDNWSTGKVESLVKTFSGATSFNRDIGGWETGSVKTMRGAFSGASVFNKDVSRWDLSGINNNSNGGALMANMFDGALQFRQSLCAWRLVFPYNDATEIFANTNCDPLYRVPVESTKQNFCSESCITETPSDSPSDQPSDQPSTSNQPSNSPSDLPSDQPSYEPSISSAPSISTMPSSEPSESPSSEPSSEPSASPSSEPSESPSSEPSSVPSESPSALPSCTPSVSPTASPSAEYGVRLFYPKWEENDEGCRNDGDEPEYMSADPNQWLSSSIEACCKRWFSGYAYDSCMGKYPTDIDDCVKLLYYPDWEGSTEGCLSDGQEPYYMLSNADYFLSNSIEQCCTKFYPWDLYGCLGTSPTLTNGNFYPDWEGRSNTCLSSSDDEVVPDYMLMNQQYYLSSTLEKCCERHFFWNINKCLGSSPDSSISGTNKWYVKWVDSACVQDCQGLLPCGGIADTWDKLYNSKEECCEKRLFWISVRECLAK